MADVESINNRSELHVFLVMLQERFFYQNKKSKSEISYNLVILVRKSRAPPS